MADDYGGGMGGYSSLYLVNPQLAVALRNQQLGLPFLQQGTQSDPIRSPWQGVNRFANAILGAVLMRRGMDQQQQSIDAQRALAGQAAQDWNQGGGMGLGQPSPQALGGVLQGGGGGAAQPPAGPSSVTIPNPPDKPPTVPPEYMPFYQEASKRTGIPVPVLIAQGAQESSFNPNATGSAGEIGLHQIKPSTATNPGFGMQGIDNPASLRDPRTNINFAADYLAARAGPNADWTNPQTIASGLQAYNGGGDPNYVKNVLRYMPGMAGQSIPLPQPGGGVAARTGGTDYAGPGGGAPGGAPGAGMPATGINSPQVQEAIALQNKAMEIRRRAAAAGFPNDPTSNMYANAYEARAKMLMGLETHIIKPGPYGPMDVNTLTNEQKPLYPRQNIITDQNGNQFLIQGDGTKIPLTTNTTGITGSGNSAERVMTELAPKIQNGTATPQEQANYATAAEKYQDYQIHTDNTGALRRLPTRPLPAGFPQPPSFVTGQPPNAPAPNAPPAGGQQSPPPPGQQTSAQPPGGDNSVLAPGLDPRIKELLGPDAKAVASADEEVAKGKGTLATTQTIRSMLPQTATGPLAMQKQATARVMATLGVSPDEIQKLTDTNLPMSEVLQKKLFELTTHAVRAMGAREPGSVMLSFANNYPGMTSQKLTIDAMTRLYDMDQIRAEDYAQGKRQAYLSGNMGNFDKNFQNSNDERVYQGAALASGGMPFDVWTRGLSNDQQVQALNLAKRVYPDARAFNAAGKQIYLNAPQNGAPGGGGG